MFLAQKTSAILYNYVEFVTNFVVRYKVPPNGRKWGKMGRLGYTNRRPVYVRHLYFFFNPHRSNVFLYRNRYISTLLMTELLCQWKNASVQLAGRYWRRMAFIVPHPVAVRRGPRDCRAHTIDDGRSAADVGRWTEQYVCWIFGRSKRTPRRRELRMEKKKKKLFPRKNRPDTWTGG